MKIEKQWCILWNERPLLLVSTQQSVIRWPWWKDLLVETWQELFSWGEVRHHSRWLTMKNGKCRGDKMQNNTNERGELKLENMNLYNWIELNWSVEVWYKLIHPLTLMGLKESTIKTLEFVTSMRSWHCLWSCTQLVFCWVCIYYIHFSISFCIF